MLRDKRPFPSISIIVLNYNSMTHLRDNFDSLLHLNYPADQLEIILADNASTDGSVAWVKKTYPIVHIVQNEDNLGYAAGNNAAVLAARGKWVVILNPDMRVESDWLMELTRPLSTNPQPACVASKVLSWNGSAIDFADAAINFMGWGCQPGYGSQHLDAYNADKPLLFANGGAMLIKRDVFLEIGGFDADYFAYYEDVDLGWRLWLHDYNVSFAARAVVFHRHHGSWEGVNTAKKQLLSERNTLFTIIKNYEDDNLARILPAALLLLLQRAYLDVRPDPSAFENTPAAPTTRIFGVRYYLKQVRDLLANGRLRELTVRAQDEVARRWRKRGQDVVVGKWPFQHPLTQHPVDGQFQVPAIALSRLLAGRELLNTFPHLLAKREKNQATRQRPDAQIFPLFQWELISNFNDDQFIHAMNQIIAKFGLVDLFGHKQAAPLSTDTRALSEQVSLLLLQRMDSIFTQSHAPESVFHIGTESPQATYAMSHADIALLAEMNTILWSLPEASLADLLHWLKQKMSTER